MTQTLAKLEVEIPYKDDLELIREILEVEFSFGWGRAFPYGYCAEASRIVCGVLGIEEIAGEYIFENDKKTGHAWNYNAERGLYVDLTLDQFERRGIVGVSILPEDIGFLNPNKKSTERQKQWRFGFKIEGIISRINAKLM